MPSLEHAIEVAQHATAESEYTALLLELARTDANPDDHSEELATLAIRNNRTAADIRKDLASVKAYFALLPTCNNEILGDLYRTMIVADAKATAYNFLPDPERGIRGTFHIAKAKYERVHADDRETLQKKLAMLDLKSKRLVYLADEALTEFLRVERQREKLDRIAAANADILGGTHSRWVKPRIEPPTPTKKPPPPSGTWCTSAPELPEADEEADTETTVTTEDIEP